MSDRSLISYEAWRESLQRFEHLITGVTGAVVAYIANSYAPHKIAFTPNTLELVSLLLLSASVAAGFIRIGLLTESFRSNFVLLHNKERLGTMASLLLSGKGVIDEDSFKPMTPEQISAEGERLRSAIARADKRFNELVVKDRKWYRRRNFLLGLGFLALLGSRVWAAYCCI